jgi:hypothetical protein
MYYTRVMVAMVESHQWYKTGLTCNRHIPNPTLVMIL